MLATPQPAPGLLSPAKPKVSAGCRSAAHAGAVCMDSQPRLRPCLADVCSSQQDLGFGLTSLMDRQHVLVLAACDVDWGVVALYPKQAVVEQSLTDGNWPSSWPGWVGGQPGCCFPARWSIHVWLQQVCHLRGQRIPRQGIPRLLQPEPGSLNATHGQGTAQVAAGLTMKAFYLHLSC